MNDPERVPEPTEGAYIQFGIPGVPFSAVRVPLLDDPAQAGALVERAIRTARWTAEKYAAAFPAQREEQRQPQRQQGRPPQRNNNRQPQGGGRGQSRADRFEVYEGEQCDECGGPVGIYPRTGQMRSDKLVCLGRCKDGEYVHTVRWLDEDGGYDDDESMPF